jgi:hypothetical protein
MGQQLGIWSAFKASDKRDDAATKEKERVKNERIREKSATRLPGARFHPPYESHFSLGIEAWKTSSEVSAAQVVHPRTGYRLKEGRDLQMEYLAMEGCVEALTEDFLFCLGKVDGMNNEAMEAWIERKLKQVAEIYDTPATRRTGRSEGLDVVIVWAENDFMIPEKGRRYMDTLIERSHLKSEKWVMAGAGHDDPIVSMEVIQEVLAFLTG